MPQPKDLDYSAMTDAELRQARMVDACIAFELAANRGQLDATCPHDWQWQGRRTGESWHVDLMRVCTICDDVDLTAAGRPAPDWPPMPAVLAEDPA